MKYQNILSFLCFSLYIDHQLFSYVHKKEIDFTLFQQKKNFSYNLWVCVYLYLITLTENGFFLFFLLLLSVMVEGRKVGRQTTSSGEFSFMRRIYCNFYIHLFVANISFLSLSPRTASPVECVKIYMFFYTSTSTHCIIH